MADTDHSVADEIKQYIEQHDVRRIRIGYTDLNGLMRGKMISVDKFLSSLQGHFSFYDGIIGASLHDEAIPGLKCTGWHTGYADTPLDIVIDSCRHIPFEEKTLFFLAEMSDSLAAICPRQVLKRVLARADDMGFSAKASLEYEFCVFNETPDTLLEKNHKKLTPLTPLNCAYSTLRTITESELHTGLMDFCQDMDFALDGLHCEEGPGFLEAAIQVDHALRAADKAALFKTFSKSFAQRLDLTFSFIARINTQLQGNGGHTHVSLFDKQGESVFFDEKKDSHISDTMRHFIAGQQRCMPEFLALVAPNINSFTRLAPGFWAPTSASWGIDNRTCALRAISGSEKSQRVEYRVPGADANPYLCIAAALASGLYGIENKLEPSKPAAGNAYLQKEQFAALPANLSDAAQQLRGSSIARTWFGDDFVKDYATTREWEAIEASKQVTDWQLARYLELT